MRRNSHSRRTRVLLALAIVALLSLLLQQWAAASQDVARLPQPQASTPTGMRPTLDLTRLPLTAQALETVRAGLTATALAATATPMVGPTLTAARATATPMVGPTVTVARATATPMVGPTVTVARPEIPQVGGAVPSPDYGGLIWIGMLCCCAGALLLWSSSRR